MRGSRWASPSDSEAVTAATGTDGQAAVWSPSRKPTEPARRSASLFSLVLCCSFHRCSASTACEQGSHQLMLQHMCTLVVCRLSCHLVIRCSRRTLTSPHMFLRKHISSCSASTACRDRASDSRCFVCRPLKPCGMRAHALLHARACHDEYALGMGF